MNRLILAIVLLLVCTGAEAANRFAVCVTTCTWDGASTVMWSTTSGGATGASVPGSADAVIIDNASCVGGVTCTITVNTNFNILSLAMTSCNASTTGCILDFSVNNNNVTIQTSFTTSGTSNGSVKFGSAVLNIVATAAGNTAWGHSASGITFVPGTSVINVSGTLTGTRTFSPGGGAYGTINILANTSLGFLLFSTGTATFANLAVTAPNVITWGTGNTISTSFALNGTSSNQVLMTSAPGTNAQVTVLGTPTVTATWTGFRDIAFSGAVAATNSMDLGDNANISFGGAGGGGCILGGWLLWRDMPDHINDNFPAWLDKAA